MKLSIHQNEHFTETEVIINCAYIDTRLQRLTDYIRQYTFSLECESEGNQYQLPIEDIFYIESVDSKTFLYDYERTYSCKQTLTTLEEKLKNTTFVRISKSCLLNVSYLKCVAPFANHRLKAELKNGEQLIISRNYVEALKDKLRK
ncbi:MAG: LytTR family DNA-binding domain-containing protein [Lachnospiraceae bacterium]|nr:LytTR family DNA-binding domain-containing protein [Lachnospiraceae bacterium]